MRDESKETELEEMERTKELGERLSRAPAGARQNVENAIIDDGTNSRSGATQNSGGALEQNDEEEGRSR
jgi:hypothetical protein